MGKNAMRKLDTSFLVDPNAPEASRQGPLKMRWYRDAEYRRRFESGEIAARWGISLRLSKYIEQWLIMNAITAFCEIEAVWRGEEQAKLSLMRFLKKDPTSRVG